MVKAEHDLPGVISDVLPKLLHASHLSDAGLVAVITAIANSLGQTVFMGQQRAMLGRTDSRPGLAQISCPTLLACGREDAITPLAVHQELAAAIAGAQLTKLDDRGHLSSLEQPERVSSDLMLSCCGKAGLGHFLRSFSLNRMTIRLKRAQKLPQPGLSIATNGQVRLAARFCAEHVTGT
jgi:hypothetical protein